MPPQLRRSQYYKNENRNLNHKRKKEVATLTKQVFDHSFSIYSPSGAKLYSIFNMPKLWLTGSFVLKLLQLLWSASSPTDSAKNLLSMLFSNPCQSAFLPSMRAGARVPE